MNRNRVDRGTYETYSDFYRAVYGNHLTNHSNLAGGFEFVEARQPAGDFSDAAVPSYIVLCSRDTAVMSTVDLGFGKRRALIAPGSFSINPPHTATEVITDGPSSIMAVGIPITLMEQHRAEAFEAAMEAADGRMHPNGVISNILHAVRQVVISGQEQEILLVQHMICALVEGVIASKKKHRATAFRGCLSDRQAWNACEHIDSELTRRVTLTELASAAGLSNFHFCRAFKASTGLAPHQFQVARRVERAKDLLAASNTSVSEIAAAVGYDDPNQLARVFRKATGISPTQYRRESRK
jgi:AraC family transcriptional regulator